MPHQLVLSEEQQSIVRGWAECMAYEHGIQTSAELELINRLGGKVPDNLGGSYIDWPTEH